MSADERSPLIIPGIRSQIAPSRQRMLARAAILFAEGFERIACYSVSGNLVFFLTKEPLCWTDPSATAAVLVFTGLMYAVGLVGGWLSDSYIGRYWTILLGYAIYFVGYFYMPYIAYWTTPGDAINQNSTSEGTACDSQWPLTHNSGGGPPSICSTLDMYNPRPMSVCSITIFSFITVIAIGAGIVRTNLAPFGGEQVREDGPKATQIFFSMYYWAINVGSLFAFIGVAWVQEINFFYGYIISSGALLMSLLCFLAGTKVYIRGRAGAKSVIALICEMYANAYRVKKLNPDLHVDRYLDYSNLCYEGGNFNQNQIKAVQKFWRVCKVLVLFIPYQMCYSQMFGSLFLLQGLHMRLDWDNMTLCNPPEIPCNCFEQSFNVCLANRTSHFDNDAIMFPAAGLATMNMVFIIVCLPFVRQFYGFLSRHNVKVYIWGRMWFGLFMASLALLAAGIVEYLRMQNICDCGYYRQSIGHTVYDSAPNIPVAYQIPQYCLLGASEVFFVVTGIEFAYMEAPRNMQGTVMGLFWFMAGIGYFIGIGLPYMFKYVDNIWNNIEFINSDKLYEYFFILAGFLFAYSLLFIVISCITDLGLKNEIIEPRSEDGSETPIPRRRRQHVNADLRSSASTNG